MTPTKLASSAGFVPNLHQSLDLRKVTFSATCPPAHCSAVDLACGRCKERLLSLLRDVACRLGFVFQYAGFLSSFHLCRVNLLRIGCWTWNPGSVVASGFPRLEACSSCACCSECSFQAAPRAVFCALNRFAFERVHEPNADASSNFARLCHQLPRLQLFLMCMPREARSDQHAIAVK